MFGLLIIAALNQTVKFLSNPFKSIRWWEMQVLIVKVTMIIFIALKRLFGKYRHKPFKGLTRAFLLLLPLNSGTNKQSQRDEQDSFRSSNETFKKL